MGKQLHAYLGFVALTAVSFFVFNWLYCYVIVFQSETNDCFFLFGVPFLLEFLDHPAGPLLYAGRFLGQFYHYPWLGALAVSTCVTCFGFLFHRIQAKLQRTVSVAQTFLPCLLLLAIHTSTFYLLHDTLGLCVSCGVFLGYLSLPGTVPKRVYALVATPIVYLLVGCYAWFFVVWIVAFEWLWIGRKTTPARPSPPRERGQGEGSGKAAVVFRLFLLRPALPMNVGRPTGARTHGHLRPNCRTLAAPASINSPLQSGLVFKVAYIPFCIAVPLVAWRWVFPIPLYSALVCPVLFEPPFRTGSPDQTATHFVVDCCLAVALCGLLLVMPFWGRLFSGTRLAAFWRAKRDRRSRVCLAIALPALAILVHWIRYDAPLATLVACRQSYKRQQWDALLEEAKRNPFGDLRVQFMTNFALYHKGTLLDEMFSYPQPWGARGLFLNFSAGPVASPAEDDTVDGMYNSDLLYEMGHANFALRHAHNTMCLRGKTYDTLKRMAQCSMLNGNYVTAAKYLNLLERTFFHRGFARRYKAILADPEAVEREFEDLRECLPTRDGFGHPVRHFVTLLDAKPDNRMAIDYLMAWSLLDKRNALETICASAAQLRIAGYASLPTHCQEAMLLMEETVGRSVDLQGFRYDVATEARVRNFLQDMSRHSDEQNAMEHALSLYADTYMFYLFFVTTPSDTPRATEDRGDFSVTPGHE